MKLNLTLISILLFIIIILILFILNNNLERFIVLNTDNNKITDTIDLPVPELNQVCTSTDCTDILWHKDCNSASYYFDSECEERRTYIFNQGKTVLGKDCHLTNLQTGCCPGQGGNGCDCDRSGNTVQKDCNGTCGGTSVIDECGVCGGDGSSCIEPETQPPSFYARPSSPHRPHISYVQPAPPALAPMPAPVYTGPPPPPPAPSAPTECHSSFTWPGGTTRSCGQIIHDIGLVFGGYRPGVDPGSFIQEVVRATGRSDIISYCQRIC